MESIRRALMLPESEKLAVEPESTFPRILVVSGTPPGDSGVGAILLRQILAVMPSEIVRVIAIQPRTAPSSAHVDVVLPRRYEHIPQAAGRVTEWLAYAGGRVVFGRHAKRLITRCVSEGEQVAATRILCVMNCPTIMHIAKAVAKRLSIPLYCFVMDAPTVVLRDFGRNRYWARACGRAFDASLGYCERLGVAGESMKTAYELRYGKPTWILRQGEASFSRQRRKAADTDVLRIGFAGSLTARREFDSLLAELDERRWRLAGRRVVLRIFGQRLNIWSSGPRHIEYFGWQSTREVIGLLGDCHFAYLPQSFELESHDFSALSFPNKLCTYVASGVPVALHAPVYSSLIEFYARYRCGPVSTSPNPSALLSEIERLVDDPAAFESHLDEVERAFRDELNEANLESNASDFLALRPLRVPRPP